MDAQHMQAHALALAQTHLHPAARVTAIGGGFYGRVFRADFPAPPYRAAVKLYTKPAIHRQEAAQLAILGAHGTLPVPEVLLIHDATPAIPAEAIIMGFIDGINAARIPADIHPDMDALGDALSENLIAYHDTVNPAGFGPLNGPFFPDFHTYYRARAQEDFAKATALLDRGVLEPGPHAVLERALTRFDAIFCELVPRACLIHGDYNTYNFMLRPDGSGVAAVIDPYGSEWTDPERDLYQLDNVNGKDYGLLSRYAARRPLSRLFPVKQAFYELSMEMMHYYDSGVLPMSERVRGEADRLEAEMKRFGLW